MPKPRFKPEDRERIIDGALHPPEQKLQGIAPAIVSKIKEIAERNKGMMR